MRAVGKAVRSRFVTYNLQKERWRFDPLTFAPLERSLPDGLPSLRIRSSKKRSFRQTRGDPGCFIPIYIAALLRDGG